MSDDPIKDAEVTLRILESRIKNLSGHLDRLWEKGKADGWPKPVMDYIMWFEHEVCRLPQAMPNDAAIIRRGLRRVQAQASAADPQVGSEGA